MNNPPVIDAKTAPYSDAEGAAMSSDSVAENSPDSKLDAAKSLIAELVGALYGLRMRHFFDNSGTLEHIAACEALSTGYGKE